MEKAIWIDASVSPDSRERKQLILSALESGFGHIIVSPNDKQSNRYGKFHLITRQKNRYLMGGKEIAESVTIRNKQDERRAGELSKSSDIVVIETSDWKVIPLENLIVQFSKSKSKLFVKASKIEDAKLFLETMERGADGIVFVPSGPGELPKLARAIEEGREKQPLSIGVVKNVKNLGLGDRVCVDTCSMLEHGEGMLVGNSSAGMFLIHAETYESEYVASRPFRINAGAVHAYTLLPSGATKYLSELRSGDEVMIVDNEGRSRPAVIGRVKMERRPLLLIEAEADGARYTTIVQNAETIRLVSGRDSISVTDLKPGDRVMLRTESGGRHFGSAVKETIREK